MEDITIEAAAEETAVFGLQFTGFYFGLEGTAFSFPIQLLQITTLRRALEVLYFFKNNIKRKAIALPETKVEKDPYHTILHSLPAKVPKSTHPKLSFIRPTFFTPQGSQKTLGSKKKLTPSLTIKCYHCCLAGMSYTSDILSTGLTVGISFEECSMDLVSGRPDF
ncbi:hypothetical protein BC938DRAFT_484015 [Jimgerdemannia flammicorona]|uniref:Uncharacterized protein n=1 Tax=Jimgerdemannia flammicorona TaxID=994334 RepID=A0A433QAR9_9FUNG|nr:hypothetical protein BC938DRAFT_484015 [Jimgerdemannia flammicorona]